VLFVLVVFFFPKGVLGKAGSDIALYRLDKLLRYHRGTGDQQAGGKHDQVFRHRGPPAYCARNASISAIRWRR
jgi:hypothetical protein